MVNLAAAIAQLRPDARSQIDYAIIDDGPGPEVIGAKLYAALSALHPTLAGSTIVE